MQDFAIHQRTELLHLPQWQALVAHQRVMAGLHLRDLFSQDAQRSERFHMEAAGLSLDYSKNRVTDLSLKLLIDLAAARGVPESTLALFNGKNVNSTEGRAALHTALREQDHAPACVHAVLAQMHAFVDSVHSGQGGFTDLVHIGIGGSDLGPRMVAKALSAYRQGPVHPHFISHMDGALIQTLLNGLDPSKTLIVVASKSFETKEVLANANIAKQWLRAGVGEKTFQNQMLAVTAYPERALAFGVKEALIFPLWDWVGGRFSLWSAMGLSVAVAIGMGHFSALLAGAHAMDEHFRQTPLLTNMPVILALLDIWTINFFAVKTRAILPYEEALSDLPAHLQQLEMESNGKRVDHAGNELGYATAPVIWGCLGSNAQHAFLQLLYQGSHCVPVDFILTTKTHPVQVSNCLSQAQALAFGKTLEESLLELREQGKTDDEAWRLAMHRVIPGNGPSTIISMPALTPANLGALIALYEHKVFVEGVIWDINSFDQWGIELGKKLAKRGGKWIFPYAMGDTKGENRDSPP